MRLDKIVLGLIVLVLCVGPAVANYQSPFGDSTANWPVTPAYSTMDDQNGIPVFHGTPSNPGTSAGTVTLADNNRLVSVLINYEMGSLHYDLWKHIRPGDLMLDTDGVEGWDYIVRSPFVERKNYTIDSEGNPSNLINQPGNWEIYKFANDIPLLDAGQYDLAKDAGTRSGQSWQDAHLLVRNNHPWAIDADWLAAQDPELVGTVYFTGWQDPSLFGEDKMGESTFIFPDNIVIIPSQLTIGFTVNCANDVLYEKIRLETPTGDVPEPASILVWAVLGLSFAGGSWRLAFQRRWARHWDDEE